MSFTIKCWVPRCNTAKDKLCLNLFPLPKDPKFKETWLALTSKKLTIAEDQVYFCERHFRSSNTETEGGRVVRLSLNALPFYGMPEMVCRTCRTTIPKTAFFCVVSAIIPSAVPPELETTLDACRPEPLYQILSFCIPNLNLEQNPPSLVCLDCYYHIWQYFLFKLKCNLTETRVRGTLSPEQYGKLVLCRSCPETSSTKFFALHEAQPIGQMFRNMFITNYSSAVVPLKLCLKCYNVLNKLMLFHKQCVLADQMIKRCVELNNTETFNNTLPPQIVPPIIDQFKSNHRENETIVCPENIPSTSGYSSSSSNVSQFSQVNEQVVRHVASPSEASIPWNSSKVDPEMPTLTIETEVEAKPTISKMLQYSDTENESKFSQESYRILVTLMLKYQHLVKPDLDPIEQAKMDLEMWINVVREIHNFGYSYNLECIQSMWSEMKSNAKTAQGILGPMTYLDFLVNSYLSNVEGEDCFITENANSSRSKPIVSVSSMIAEREKIVKLKRLRFKKYKTGGETHYNAKVLSDKNTAINDCDVVICLDDDDDDDDVKGFIPPVNISSDSMINHNDVNGKQNKNTAITECVQGGSSSAISHKPKRPVSRPTKPRDDSQPPKLRDDSQLPKLGRPPKPQNDTSSHSTLSGKTKRGRVARPKRKWNVFQKLQLVRAMHKELNRQIEAEELGSLQFPPWKKILQKLASERFLNADFSKLYTVWGAMKRSATIYEKDGTDVVDMEVWDLLQLYSEVQKGVTNKSPSGKTNSNKRRSTVSNEDGIDGKAEESDPPPKVQKLNTSSAVNSKNSESHVSRQDLQRDKIISSKQTEKMQSLVKGTAVSNRKKGRVRFPVEDKMEILNLVEQAFKKILRKGPIDSSISEVLRSIKYKNYSSCTMNHIWFNLARATISIERKDPTPLQKKFLKVLKIYRDGKVCKKVNVFGAEKNARNHTNGKTEETTDVAGKGRKQKNFKSQTNEETEKTTDAAEKGGKEREEKGEEAGIKRAYLKKKLNDKDKVELIAIIRSFGNEVFKKKDRLSGNTFWNKVASKFTGRRGKLLLSQEWGNMLASAKVTWAQGDREPKVGDKEIIEFMTEVIKEKEKAKEESSVEDGKMIENAEKDGENMQNDDENTQNDEENAENNDENAQNNDENTQNDDGDSTTDEELISGEIFKNCKEVLKNVAPVTIKQEVFAVHTQMKVEQGSASGSGIGSYDYVSLDDINKHYGARTVEKPEPLVINEVIEIPDSDEE